MSQNSALERALSFGECLSTLEIRAKLADIGLARVTMLDCFCYLRIVRV